MPRCFIGLPITPEISAELSQTARSLMPNLKLIPENNHHITLAFLANQPPDKLALIRKLLGEIHFQKFQITIFTIAAFPKPSSHILAGWVSPVESLIQLQKAVVNVLHNSAIEFPDRHSFIPHISLARNKPALTSRHSNQAAAHFQETAMNLSMEVPKMNLYLSEPGNGAMNYSVLESVAANAL